MSFKFAAFLLPLALAQQNPICPLCSMGAPGVGGYGTIEQQQQQTQQPMSFSSYQRNPLAMYQGDAALFGTELGRAIAQRIQQIYSNGVPNTGRMNSGSSFNSYPDQPRPPVSQSSYNSMEVLNLAPPSQAPIDYGSARGGCPYCFGGGHGGYAHAPPRPRRVEFVADKKTKA